MSIENFLAEVTVEESDFIKTSKLDLKLKSIKKVTKDRNLKEHYILENKNTQKRYIMKEKVFSNKKDLVNNIKWLKIIKNIRHNNFLNLLDFSTITNKGWCNTFYICKEFYEYVNLDLNKEIEERRENNEDFKIEELNGLLINLVDILSLLQNNGISHGNISPKQILRNNLNNSEYKLINLENNSKNIIEIKRNNYIEYKNNSSNNIYMSPEIFYNIIQRKKDFVFNTHKSDAFSLGILLLECSLLESVNDIYIDEKEGLISENVLNELLNKFEDKYGCENLFYRSLKLILNINENDRLDFTELLDDIKHSDEYKIHKFSSFIESNFSDASDSENENKSKDSKSYNSNININTNIKVDNDINPPKPNFNIKLNRNFNKKVNNNKSNQGSTNIDFEVSDYISEYFPQYHGDISINKYRIDQDGNKYLVEEPTVYFNNKPNFEYSRKSYTRTVSIKKYVMNEHGEKILIESESVDKSFNNNENSILYEMQKDILNSNILEKDVNLNLKVNNKTEYNKEENNSELGLEDINLSNREFETNQNNMFNKPKSKQYIKQDSKIKFEIKDKLEIEIDPTNKEPLSYKVIDTIPVEEIVHEHVVEEIVEGNNEKNDNKNEQPLEKKNKKNKKKKTTTIIDADGNEVEVKEKKNKKTIIDADGNEIEVKEKKNKKKKTTTIIDADGNEVEVKEKKKKSKNVDPEKPKKKKNKKDKKAKNTEEPNIEN